jgi:hypothetical protein
MGQIDSTSAGTCRSILSCIGFTRVCTNPFCTCISLELTHETTGRHEIGSLILISKIHQDVQVLCLLKKDATKLEEDLKKIKKKKKKKNNNNNNKMLNP